MKMHSENHRHDTNGNRRRFNEALLGQRGPRSAPPKACDLPLSWSHDLRGVYICRTRDDLNALTGAKLSGRRAAVIGSGPLGIAAAEIAASRGMETTVIESAHELMPGYADAERRDVLGAYLDDKSIQVRTGATVKCLRGEEQITCVRLIGDYLIPTDVLIVTPTCGCAKMPRQRRPSPSQAVSGHMA